MIWNNIIVFALLAINIYALYKKRESGLAMYCVLAMTAPVAGIGTIIVSYEILGAVVCFIFEGYRFIKEKSIKLHKGYLFLGTLISIYLAGTLISVAYWNVSMKYVTFAGALRFCIMIVILTQDNFLEQWFECILKAVLAINVFAAAIQAFIPNSCYLFLQLYQKESGRGPYHTLLKSWHGVYKRCFGTYQTPTVLGIIALMGTLFFLYKFLYKRENDRKTILYLGAAIFCGMASSMKMYWLGLAICIIAMFCGTIIFRLKLKYPILQIDKKKVVKMGVLLVCCIMIGWLLNAKGVAVYKYIKRSFSLNNLFSSMDARYDAEDGLAMKGFNEPVNELVEDTDIQETDSIAVSEIDGTEDHTVHVNSGRIPNGIIILQRIIGVGAAEPTGVWVIDSQWMYFIRYYGIMGMLLIFFWMFGKVITSWKKAECDNLLYVLMLLILGVVNTVLNNFWGILVISYIAVNKSGSLLNMESKEVSEAE